jgi:hypothetical protein
MLFPLYTHVHVPAGTPIYHAVWADKLNEKNEPVVNLDIKFVDEDFDGVIVKLDNSYHWGDIRPTGDHTKIENPATEKTFMFLDSMIKDKITRL